MIRIQLGRKPGAASRLRRVLWLLAGLLVVVAVAVGARQIPLDLWQRWSAGAAEEAGDGLAATPASEPAPWPRRSDVCRRVLHLSHQLPAGVRFTTLAGRADGEYALRGTGSPASVQVLLGAVDALSAVSDDVGLSYWHTDGDSLTEVVYHLSGSLPDDGSVQLELLPASGARDLVAGIEGRARASGLSQILTEALDRRVLDPAADVRSHKLWASGSLEQIRVFAESLGEVESQARVEEVVVALASQADGAAPWGQVSASFVMLTESAQEER